MDKKLTIIFKDGHINIGPINVIGIGILTSQDVVLKYLKDFKWIEVENGWTYNTNQISRIKDCTDNEINQIIREEKLKKILNDNE
jgi:hypothetical protein